jgi:hypothetical protein
MWVKGIFLLLFALTIDALQAIMAWIFLAAGSAIALVPLVGVVGAPMGVGLGFAVDIAISMTMGSGLILALFIFDMLDLKYVAAVFIGETIPGLDIIPGWTFLVIRCILKKNAEEGHGIVALASGIGSAALAPTNPTRGLGAVAQSVSGIKNTTGEMARASSLVRNTYSSEPAQNIARERTQLASDVGREITPRPSSPGPNTLHAKTA